MAGGVPNQIRRIESLALPREASFNCPSQNAWVLEFELFKQSWIALVLGYRDGEGYKVQTATNCFVYGAKAWLMVTGDDQFELRYELKEVLAHEPGGDPIATRQRLDFDSAQRAPSSVSMAVTIRAPRSPASSVGCFSVLLTVKTDMGAVFAKSPIRPASVERNTLFPFSTCTVKERRLRVPV